VAQFNQQSEEGTKNSLVLETSVQFSQTHELA